MQLPFTKNSYLLYSLLIFLLVSACKKTEKVLPQADKNENSLADQNNAPGTATGNTKLLNLRINGAKCAFDSISRAYYFPVSMGTSLTGYRVNFDSTAAVSVYVNGNKFKSGDLVNFPLETGKTVEIDAANNLDAKVFYNLIITGLPMVMIQMKNNSDAIDSLKRDGAIDIVDPDHDAHKVDLQTHAYITLATRGATARYLLKKSYKLNTVDAADNARDLPLLGLRNDEDWILDAMYIDQSRMRNRLCTDLWNSFNNVPYLAQEPDALNGTRGYMTEVFLNGKYQGVYCLTEKLDRKQLKVKKAYGAVYKSDVVTGQTAFTINQPYDNSSATWNGWEFSYPDLDDAPAPTWAYLSNIIGFIATSSDVDFSSDIKNRVDINNLVDYFIFTNVIQASDNSAKNQYFSFYDYRTNGNSFTRPGIWTAPWGATGAEKLNTTLF